MLQSVVAGSFHTIVVSAHTDQAVAAFAYGVHDFVPKPFGEERLTQAFARLNTADKPNQARLKFLAVRKAGHFIAAIINCR